MKFTADSATGNTILAYQPGEIRLRDEVLRTHAIIAQNKIIPDWNPAPLGQLSITDFSLALELQPEIILFGTGVQQHFPAIALLTEIMQAGIAIEVMQTSAACRTYNVLIGEHRAVVAALLIE